MNQEEVFAQLGFNQLEAEVYVALLKHGPQTAYKIGKLLNRPTANVYKAVDVLAFSGAIEVEEGSVKVCRAIAIKSLAQQLQNNYKNKIDKAVAQLSNLKTDVEEEGIYKLQTVDSVFQRALEMLKRSNHVVVVDAFPKALTKLGDELNKLPKKGVEVFVEAYEPIKLQKGVSVVIPGISKEALKYWKAQQLNIAVDGKEILIALFNNDLSELIQATYSNNLYLSCIVYSGLLSEHKTIQFSNAKNMDEIAKIKARQKFFYNSNVPGLEQLFKQYKSDLV
jgi:HTH-type transcriptional regulator, sugar sensing transcriptional regulator